MRITFVTDTFPPEVNGVAKSLHRFVTSLRDSGNEVAVIRPGFHVDGGGETTRIFSVPFPGYRGLRIGLPCRLKLTRLWSEQRPHIVYVATESPLGLSAIKAAAALGIPVVCGYHTNYQLYVDDYRMGALRGFATEYLKSVHNRADCTFAPAEDIGRDLVSEGYHNVRLLGRGVDADLFHPGRRDEGLRREWGARGRAPVVCVVGRVAAEKNLDLAFTAFAAMRARCPDARLVIVGDGPRRAGYQAANPGVVFAGMRHGEDLARHYASADIFLFPSMTETFGNVLLEALSSGLVTVSYKYAASAQHVLHPENGLQAAFGDATAFVAQSLESLALSGDPAMRAAARQVAERTSWDAVIQQFEQDLREIVQGSTEEPPSVQRGIRPHVPIP